MRILFISICIICFSYKMMTWRITTWVNKAGARAAPQLSANKMSVPISFPRPHPHITASPRERKSPINTMTLPKNDIENSPGKVYPQTQTGGPGPACPLTPRSLSRFVPCTRQLNPLPSLPSIDVTARTRPPAHPPPTLSSACFCCCILHYFITLRCNRSLTHISTYGKK